MNIKEMEQRSGLPRSGIRFYESEGLLSPARSPNGYRDYSEDDLDTLMKIKRLRSLGLSLQEIKEVQSGALPLADALRAQLVRLGSMRGEMARAEAECRSLIDAGAGWADGDGDGILERDGVRASFSCLYPADDSVRQAVAMAAAEQVRKIGIEIVVEGTSWDDIAQRMFSEAVMMGWGSSSPNETYYLYRSAGAYLDDYYNPEGYASQTTDAYLDAAMEALTVEEANRNWQLAQWDGTTGTAMRGACPWVWIVNLDHVTYVREGLSIGEQPIHGHGHGLPLVQNLEDWAWEETQDA